MSWISIPREEYHDYYTADYEISDTHTLTTSANVPYALEVEMEGPGPKLKHRIYSNFALLCWKWED